MRETLRDWQKEWLEEFGVTDDVEVVVRDRTLEDLHASCVYEGTFADIPEELLDRKVIECGRIVDSSIPNRIGAYSLDI